MARDEVYGWLHQTCDPSCPYSFVPNACRNQRGEIHRVKAYALRISLNNCLRPSFCPYSRVL